MISRAPRGARGLKSDQLVRHILQRGRAPRGARGLKLRLRAEVERDDNVAPLAGRVD